MFVDMLFFLVFFALHICMLLGNHDISSIVDTLIFNFCIIMKYKELYINS